MTQASFAVSDGANHGMTKTLCHCPCAMRVSRLRVYPSYKDVSTSECHLALEHGSLHNGTSLPPPAALPPGGRGASGHTKKGPALPPS